MSSKGYIEKLLSNYFLTNTHSSFEVDDENRIIILCPWNRNDARLVGKAEDKGFVDALNNIRLSNKFDAIFHTDANLVEFIYAFLDPTDDNEKEIIDRNFWFHYSGRRYNCYFAEPTDRLYAIAKSFERLHYELHSRSVRQIAAFKNYTNVDDSNERRKAYFDKRVPRSFFVQCPEPSDDALIEALARHMNFAMTSYDRGSPTIQLYEDSESPEKPEPIRYIEGAFPDEFSVPEMDDFLLKLLEVGRVTSARFSFVYYYQVLEYAGYYHIDAETRSKLKRFLKDPTVINCSEDKISELLNLLPSLNHNDEVKIRKMISAYCDPSVIWKEIENDKDFFSNSHCFEGGFETKALISNSTDLLSWNTMWMPKLYDYLTKIRNALVHARERRENKVILPTLTNNRNLERLTPLIRRMAEQIALGATK